MTPAIVFLFLAIGVYIMKLSGTFSIDIPDSQPESQVERIAKAIARAEGFFTDSTLLQSLNNPVGLKLDGRTLTRFDTVEKGWEAAYKQVRLILTNQSGIYNRDMSIAQIAPVWTGNDNPESWSKIVSGQLGVDKNTPIYQV